MKDNFRHQTVVDPAGLARYLTALAEGVERGALPLADGELDFVLHPRGLIDLSLKIRRKNGRTRLALELGWAEEESELPLLTESRKKP
jgi:hypothetical protein